MFIRAICIQILLSFDLWPPPPPIKYRKLRKLIEKISKRVASSIWRVHQWSPPHSISVKPRKPEQLKVYARKTWKTPENSGKLRKNPNNQKSMPGKPGKSPENSRKPKQFRVFRVVRVFRSIPGFPEFSGLFGFFGVFWVVQVFGGFPEFSR